MKKYYEPVLLIQGFGLEQVGPGLLENFTYNADKGRGIVKAVDVLSPLDESALFESPFTFTLTANGQELITNANWTDYSYRKMSGKDNEEFVNVQINERGKFKLEIDNTIVSTPATAQLYFLAYYTTPEHDEFLRKFKWGNKLGQKSMSFRFLVPNGTAAGQTLGADFIVPSERGDIIAISMNSPAQAQRIGRSFNVKENGIEIVKNYPLSAALSWSGRRDNIFKKLIRPASTMRLEVNLETGFAATQDEYYFLTLYFDN